MDYEYDALIDAGYSHERAKEILNDAKYGDISARILIEWAMIAS